jgi:hypothetical protein
MWEVPSRVLGRVLPTAAGYVLFFLPTHTANDGIVSRQGLERFLKILFHVVTTSLNEHPKINNIKNLLEPLHWPDAGWSHKVCYA